MIIYDFFSGLEGWSKPFRARGHQVFTLDNDPRFGADEQRNLMDLTPADFPGRPDLILASPPCTKFTVMQIGTNWTREGTPKTASAAEALLLVQHTVNLIAGLGPRFWIMENPRAKLRKLYPMTQYERRTVTYCQYGEPMMKPTDLWGVFPPSLELLPSCHNGDPCHTAAPRGSRTASQGMDSALVAKIPEQLALAVCLAAERDT